MKLNKSLNEDIFKREKKENCPLDFFWRAASDSSDPERARFVPCFFFDFFSFTEVSELLLASVKLSSAVFFRGELVFFTADDFLDLSVSGSLSSSIDSLAFFFFFCSTKKMQKYFYPVN